MHQASMCPMHKSVARGTGPECLLLPRKVWTLCYAPEVDMMGEALQKHTWILPVSACCPRTVAAVLRRSDLLRRHAVAREELAMKITRVQVILLSYPIPLEKQWRND